MKKEWAFRSEQMADSLSAADAFVEETALERQYRIKLRLSWKYNAVIEAVENGEISEMRINESVNRILRTKRMV